MSTFDFESEEAKTEPLESSSKFVKGKRPFGLFVPFLKAFSLHQKCLKCANPQV